MSLQILIPIGRFFDTTIDVDYYIMHFTYILVHLIVISTYNYSCSCKVRSQLAHDCFQNNWKCFVFVDHTYYSLVYFIFQKQTDKFDPWDHFWWSTSYRWHDLINLSCRVNQFNIGFTMNSSWSQLLLW